MQKNYYGAAGMMLKDHKERERANQIYMENDLISNEIAMHNLT